MWLEPVLLIDWLSGVLLFALIPGISNLVRGSVRSLLVISISAYAIAETLAKSFY